MECIWTNSTARLFGIHASCWLYLNYNVVLNNLKSRNKIKFIIKTYRSLIYTGSNIYKYSNKSFFVSLYSSSVIAPISFKSNKSLTCLIASDRNLSCSAAAVVEFPTYEALISIYFIGIFTAATFVNNSYGLHFLEYLFNRIFSVF